MLDRNFIVPILKEEVNNREFNEHKETKHQNIDDMIVSKYLEDIRSNIFPIETDLNKLYQFIFLNSYIPNLEPCEKIVNYILNESLLVEFEPIIVILFEINLLCGNFYEFFIDYLKKSGICDKYQLEIVRQEYPKITNEIIKISEMVTLADKILKTKNYFKERTKLLALCLIFQHKNVNIYIKSESERQCLDTDLLIFFSFLINGRTKNLCGKWISCRNEDLLDLKLIYVSSRVDKFYILSKALQDLEHPKKKEIIISNRSSRLLNFFFNEFFDKKDFFSILIDSFDENSTDYIISIFNKLFNMNKYSAEKMLKQFIIQTKTTKLSNLLFEKSETINSDFIEACIINSKNIDNLKTVHIVEISKTHYFSLLTRDLEMFRKCLRILENINTDLENGFSPSLSARYLFDENIKFCEKSMKKVEIYLEKFPETSDIIFPHFLTILESLNQRYGRNLPSNIESDFQDVKSNSLISVKTGLFTREFIDVFYSIIFHFRDEELLRNFIPVFIKLDFVTFLSKCLFRDLGILDDFFIVSTNEIIEMLDYIPERCIFIKELVNYKEKCRQKNTFTSVILFKSIYLFKIIEKDSFLNMINQVLSEKTDPTSENQKHFFEKSKTNAVEKKDNFIISNFYNDDLLIRKIIEKVKNEEFEHSVLIGDMLDILNKNNQFHEGMVFNNSKIEILVPFKSFCFYGIYIQYNSKGKQSIFELFDEEFYLGISLQNGRLMKVVRDNGNTDTFLMKDDFFLKKKIYIGIKVVSEKITIHINESKYVIKIKSYRKIVIGHGFRGVITRILFYNNDRYDKKYLTDMPRSEYFVSYISDLEKVLKFRNGKGLYMDNLTPYCFTTDIKIKIKNVFINVNKYWIDNNELTDAIINKSEKCDQFKKLFITAISKLMVTK